MFVRAVLNRFLRSAPVLSYESNNGGSGRNDIRGEMRAPVEMTKIEYCDRNDEKMNAPVEMT